MWQPKGIGTTWDVRDIAEWSLCDLEKLKSCHIFVKYEFYNHLKYHLSLEIFF